MTLIAGYYYFIIFTTTVTSRAPWEWMWAYKILLNTCGVIFVLGSSGRSSFLWQRSQGSPYWWHLAEISVSAANQCTKDRKGSLILIWGKMYCVSECMTSIPLHTLTEKIVKISICTTSPVQSNLCSPQVCCIKSFWNLNQGVSSAWAIMSWKKWVVTAFYYLIQTIQG